MANDMQGAYSSGYRLGQAALQDIARKRISKVTTVYASWFGYGQICEMEVPAYLNKGEKIYEIELEPKDPLQQKLWAASREFRLASMETIKIYCQLLGFIQTVSRNSRQSLLDTIEDRIKEYESHPMVFSEMRTMELCGIDLHHNHGRLEMNGDPECDACMFCHGFINGQARMLIGASQNTGKLDRKVLDRLLIFFSKTKPPPEFKPWILERLGIQFMDFQADDLQNAINRKHAATSNLIDVYTKMNLEYP